MTTPERAASKGAARGPSTSSELVQVYRILSEAEQPLTVPQIAERFPRPGFISAAMQKYAKHQAKAQPAWLDGKSERWSDAAQAEAMTWWIREVVSNGIHSRIFTTKAKPGRSREGTYLPARPPKVRRRIWEEKWIDVDWSPELETELTRGHAAGMEFIAQLDDYRRKSKPSAATKALLALAERAIRAHQ